MTAVPHVVIDARATTPHFPGVGRATLGLLRGLSSIEHLPRISVLYHDAAPLPQDIVSDPRFEIMAVHAAPLGLAQQWQLPLLARRIDADVWHAPYYVRPLWHVPLPIVTVFDVIGHLLPSALPSLRARLLFELTLRSSLRGAAHVITSSAATQRDLAAVYRVPMDQITVIPLASEVHFKPQPTAAITTVRERYDLPMRYLLYVGSNKPHKNLALLVRAFAKVSTDTVLVIAGHWDVRYPEPRQLVRTLQLEGRVRFIHNIPDADLPALLSGALAFVFPSRYEGFGLPPLEAMACGTPVIASRTSSLPEVVGDAGLLVPPRSDQLAAAIAGVVDDAALRDRLRAQGLERAQHFSWAATARQTLTVYEQVARQM